MKRYTVHVAAATRKPFESGYSEYRNVTVASWLRRKSQIVREHGGNIVTRWFREGVEVSKDDIVEEHARLWTNL